MASFPQNVDKKHKLLIINATKVIHKDFFCVDNFCVNVDK